MFKPKWEYISSKYLSKTHITIYRDNTLGVQMQIVTKRNQLANPEKAKFYYFIDGDKRVFHSEEEMMNKLRKKIEKEDAERYSLIVHWARSDTGTRD